MYFGGKLKQLLTTDGSLINRGLPSGLYKLAASILFMLARDQPMPGSFPVPPNLQGESPGTWLNAMFNKGL